MCPWKANITVCSIVRNTQFSDIPSEIKLLRHVYGLIGYKISSELHDEFERSLLNIVPYSTWRNALLFCHSLLAINWNSPDRYKARTQWNWMQLNYLSHTLLYSTHPENNPEMYMISPSMCFSPNHSKAIVL